jgi:hypothetical protein
MIGRKAPAPLQIAIRIAFFALVLLAAVSPRTGAQELRVDLAGVSAPIGGASAATPAGAVFSAAGVVSAAAPSSLASPSMGRVAAPVPALAPSAAGAASAARPAAPAAAAASRADAGASARSDGEAGRRNLAGPAALLERPASSGPGRAAPVIAPLSSADGPLSAEADREGAQRDFSALLGERLADGKGADAAPVAETASSPSGTRLAARGRAAAGFIVGVPAVLALGLHPDLHAVLHPSLAAWHAISQAGNVAGNLASMVSPLFLIRGTLRGESTPKSRTIIGASAALGLGLLMAYLSASTPDVAWSGVQNLFVAITMAVSLAIGWVPRKVRGKELKETALITAAALAASVAAYFAIAVALPGLLAAVFSAAVLSKGALAVQVGTYLMFLWQFLPDTFKVLRGHAPKGFTPGFSLLYFAASVGMMIWALPGAFVFHDAHNAYYRLLFGYNSISALASFISFWSARRHAKLG